MLFAQYISMVSVVELVDTPDCGSGAAALRVQVSSLTPNGRVAEWFKAPSWKGGEGNTSASSNLVSSSKETCIGSRGNGERRAI